MNKLLCRFGLTNVFVLILLLNTLNVFDSNAKIVTKRFSLSTPFSLQTPIDINGDGIQDLSFEPEAKIQSIRFNWPCNSPGSLCFDSSYTCAEYTLAPIYVLKASNINTSLVEGNIYQGEEMIERTQFTSWPNMSFRNELIFYQSNYWTYLHLNKNGIPCYQKNSTDGEFMDFFDPQSFSKKYIAFTILGANGVKHYAWMRRISILVYEVIYEDRPNYPIVVGGLYGKFNIGQYDKVISGFVYEDTNNDCTKNALEKGVPNVLVKGVSNNKIYHTYTNSEGRYDLVVGDNSNYKYTLSIEKSNEIINNFISQSCSSPTIMTNDYSGTYSNINLGVKAVSCAPITLSINSSNRRRCATNVNYINYRNNQNSDENDFLIKVLLPEYIKPIASMPAWTSVSGDTLFYHLGTLSANTSGQIKIIDSVICWNPSITGKTVCTQAWASRGCIISPPEWDRSEIKVSGNCMQQKNHWTIFNMGADMADSAEYRIFYDNVLIKRQQYKLSEGESLSFNFAINGHTIRIEADQSPHHPYIRYAAAFIEGCGAVQTDDFIKNIAQAFPLPSIPSETISCRAIVDSYDPNDKNGYPTGYGDEHLVEKNTDLTYTIRFQNTGTADAYTVVLADSLSQYLDPLTTEFLGSSHPYRIEYRGGATPLLVWIFDNINLSPESVDAETSQGFVTYRIKQQKDLPDGTVIRNKAHIYFDYNDAIITNTTVHTIGKPYTENVLKVVHEPENISFCKKDHSTALYTLGTGIGTLHYQWKKDGQDLAGSNSDTLYLSEELLLAGNYYCEISNFLDTIKTRTATVVGPMENPVVYAQVSKTSLCPNESVVLTGLGAFSYTWDHDVVDGEAFVPSATKIYTVTGTDPNGCSGTNSLMVEVLESPALEITPPATECAGTPIDITASYTDRAATEGAVTFWKDAGAVQVLENPAAILEEGIYYIRKEANGCADIQPVLVVYEDCFPTAISNHTSYSQIVIYPNPSHDFIMVRSEKMLPFAYKIYSNAGAVVGNSTSYNNQISVLDLPVGSYYLEIHLEETVSRFRFNKQ
jgi:uncharacterized repeat protein (TIGR01451 family)